MNTSIINEIAAWGNEAMNNERRKRLNEALVLLDQAQAIVDQALQIVEEVRGDEEEAFDSLPESFQQGERGENMQAAISALENVELANVFDDARNNIEEAQGA